MQDQWSNLLKNFKTAFKFNTLKVSDSVPNEAKCEYYENLLFVSPIVDHQKTKTTSIWSNKKPEGKSKATPPKIPKWVLEAQNKQKNVQSCAENLENLRSTLEKHIDVMMGALSPQSKDYYFDMFAHNFAIIP